MSGRWGMASRNPTGPFTILEPQDRRILFYSGTSYDGFWGSKVVKGSVGKWYSTCTYVVQITHGHKLGRRRKRCGWMDDGGWEINERTACFVCVCYISMSTIVSPPLIPSRQSIDQSCHSSGGRRAERKRERTLFIWRCLQVPDNIYFWKVFLSFSFFLHTNMTRANEIENIIDAWKNWNISKRYVRKQNGEPNEINLFVTSIKGEENKL